MQVPERRAPGLHRFREINAVGTSSWRKAGSSASRRIASETPTLLAHPAVGDNRVALALECPKVVRDLTVEEGRRVQRGLIDHHGHALGLRAACAYSAETHDGLNKALRHALQFIMNDRSEERLRGQILHRYSHAFKKHVLQARRFRL